MLRSFPEVKKEFDKMHANGDIEYIDLNGVNPTSIEEYMNSLSSSYDYLFNRLDKSKVTPTLREYIAVLNPINVIAMIMNIVGTVSYSFPKNVIAFSLLCAFIYLDYMLALRRKRALSTDLLETLNNERESVRTLHI